MSPFLRFESITLPTSKPVTSKVSSFSNILNIIGAPPLAVAAVNKFILLKTAAYQVPIPRSQQIFLFDGVRKRKVILRKIRPITERLKEF